MGSCSGKLNHEKSVIISEITSNNNNNEPGSQRNSNLRDYVAQHRWNLEPGKLEEIKIHEMYVLLKFMSNARKDISECAHEVILGISFNNHGAMCITPTAIKQLIMLMDSTADPEDLLSCIAILYMITQDSDQTIELYIVGIDMLVETLHKYEGELLCGVISLLGSMASTEEIICDMLDKNIHEILADKFHSTEDPLVKRQIFITLHNFINVKNSEKIMHPNVIRILIKTIQDEYGDPPLRYSALRILSCVSMSGNNSLLRILYRELKLVLQYTCNKIENYTSLKMLIGELGGIPALTRLVLVPTNDLKKYSDNREIAKMAGMTLSALCSVQDLQAVVFHEWGISNMITFLEIHAAETNVVLAVVMGLNNLLDNREINKLLRAHHPLKIILRNVQQNTDNEDLYEECIESISKLLPRVTDFRNKFEKIHLQNYSPSLSLTPPSMRFGCPPSPSSIISKFNSLSLRNSSKRISKHSSKRRSSKPLTVSVTFSGKQPPNSPATPKPGSNISLGVTKRSSSSKSLKSMLKRCTTRHSFIPSPSSPSSSTDRNSFPLSLSPPDNRSFFLESHTTSDMSTEESEERSCLKSDAPNNTIEFDIPSSSQLT